MNDIDSGYGINKDSLDIDAARFAQTGNIFQASDETLARLYSRNGAFAYLDSALTSTLYGIDIFGTGSPAQQLHEQFGLIFFTRPMLNLSYDNITRDRTLTPLLTKESSSIGRYVKAILDPLGPRLNGNQGYDCPLVDPTNPFIPLLSNTVESLSGWQDPILDVFQSAAGLKKESWSVGDSSNKVYGTFQLSSSFRNTRGNILGYLFHVWQTYISLQYEGIIDPYPVFIRKFTIDYQSRIYRLVLDQTRTFVQEIIANGACFPLANNAGSRGNYNRATPVNQEQDTYSQTWQSMGAFYYDPGMMYDFNTISTMLKPGFNDSIESRNQNYRRLYPREYKLFTYQCFPRIHPTSARLEWWVPMSVYTATLGAVDYEQMNFDGN